MDPELLTRLVDELDPSIRRQLAAASLNATDVDLRSLVAAAPALGRIQTVEELHAAVGPLWRDLLDSDLQYRSRPGFALGTSVAIRLMEAHDSTVARESLWRVGFQLEPSVGNALFRLGLVEYEEGRERRSTIAESAQCFKSAVRAFERALLYDDVLSEATRVRLLGMLGVAAAFLAREDAVSLAELLVAHRRFERSIELGNGSDEALVYLTEIRIRLYQHTGNRSLLEGLRRRLRNRHGTSPQLQLRRAEVLLQLAALEVDRGRQTPATRWRELTMELLQELVEAVDGVGPESLDAHDAVSLLSLRRIRDELSDVVEVGDASGFRLDSGALTFPFGGGRSLSNLRAALGDNATERVLKGLATDLDQASARHGAEALREFALKYYRVLARNFPASTDSRDVQLAMEEIADRALDGPISDRGRAAACDVLFTAWRLGRNPHVAARLVDYLIDRADTDAVTVWPVLRLADLARNPAVGKRARGTSKLAADVRSGNTKGVLAEAARRAHLDPAVERRVLGGRSEVYVALQESGYLEDRFVFKTTEPLAAERERRRITRVPDWVHAAGRAEAFRAPSVLEVLEQPDGQTTLVLQRAGGETLDARRSVTRDLLENVSSYLALLHVGLLEESDLGGRNDFAAETRRLLMRPPFVLSRADADGISEIARDSMERLPTLPKRDAHPGNWIIDRDESITAIDLSTRGGRPLFLELMQLLDDGCHLPVTATALQDRVAWAKMYLNWVRDHAVALGTALPDLPTEISVGDIAPAVLCRSVFLMCLAERNDLPRSRRVHLARHGRELLAALEAGAGGAIGDVAVSLNSQLRTMGARRTRLSRRMAAVLRHDDTAGIDDRGWLSLESLDRAYVERHGGASNMEQFVQLANHYADTRFELDGHRIRARYGHSTGVELGYLPEEPPAVLFHGTSEASVGSILDSGIEAMSRDFVHLVATPAMAERVGRRHGTPAVLRVDTKLAAQQGVAFLPAVEGIWLASRVPANSVRVAEVDVKPARA